MNGDGRHAGNPPSTTHILLSIQLSTEYKIRMSNLCAQHDTVPEFKKHRDIVTCMRANAIPSVGGMAISPGGHEATDTGLAYAPVSQAHGHNHIVQCFSSLHCSADQFCTTPRGSTRGGGGGAFLQNVKSWSFA